MGDRIEGDQHAERGSKMHLLWVAQEVQRDLEADMNRREGQEFNGRNVAEALGELSGTVAGLAGVVERLVLLLPDEPAPVPQTGLGGEKEE